MKYCLILFLINFSILSMAQPNKPTSGLYKWNDLIAKSGDHRVGRQLMEGSTQLFEYFEVHATTQEKGAMPRPPHAQEAIEEIMIVTEGTLRFTMDDEQSVLSAGSVICIPPHAMQALQNIGDGPLTYFVLMYRSKSPMDVDRNNKNGNKRFYNIDSLTSIPNAKGSRTAYFDKATAQCTHAELHTTFLNHKGPSHDAHYHDDMELILITRGHVTVDIAGKEYTGGANDLILIESNLVHQVMNAADLECAYFAVRLK